MEWVNNRFIHNIKKGQNMLLWNTEGHILSSIHIIEEIFLCPGSPSTTKQPLSETEHLVNPNNLLHILDISCHIYDRTLE